MKKKIYVAEDFPSQVDLLKTVFESQEDMEVSFYSDGLELYSKVQNDPPDLLILDIILPSLSGLAISRLLKYHEKYSHIPVIATSSITDPAIEQRALSMGADVFLPKPIKVREFLASVRELLSLN